MTTKKITAISLFTALAVITNLFSFNTGVKHFMVSFNYIPCFIAGAFLGPVEGFIVGFMGDLLGGLIRPLGPYILLIGIASGLLGFIPGMVFKYLKLNDYLKLIVSMLLCLIICTAGINTYALFLTFSKGKSFWAYLGVRLPFQSAVAVMNLAVLAAAWKPLKFLNKKYYSK